ncbi:unnamed protein product [Adineta ricciae]|uniref:Uncharacterized protein n=1 Tax=Adineta ricciae TaxID=249248 RepID=A0A815N5M8_ADIRI|nr:unnamed protein product [Adineta ricciae]
MSTELFHSRQSEFSIYFSYPWKSIQTGYIILTWIVLGFHVELVGPTIPTLAASIHSHYTEMGALTAVRSLGYLIANCLGIFLQHTVDNHSYPVLTCGFILPAIVMFSVPFVKSVILLYVLFFFQGVSLSLTDIAGTHLLLTIWGIDSAPPLGAMHTGYGIGALLAILLVRPFLIETGASVNHMSSEKFNIIGPYLIAGSLCTLIALGNLFFAFREAKNKRERLEFKQSDYGTLTSNGGQDEEVPSPYSPRTFGYGDYRYGLTLCIIFICYMFFVGGNDHTFGFFFFTYLKLDKLNLSNSAANWGNILFWIANIVCVRNRLRNTNNFVGRLLVCVLAIYFSTFTLSNIAWFGSLYVAVLWLLWIWSSDWIIAQLLILGTFTGLAMAPLVQLSLAFINERLKVTPVLIAYVYSGSALGALVFHQTTGYIMDHDPNYFPTLFFISTLAAILLYILSNGVYYFHRRKNLSNAQSSDTATATLLPENLDRETK